MERIHSLNVSFIMGPAAVLTKIKNLVRYMMIMPKQDQN